MEHQPNLFATTTEVVESLVQIQTHHLQPPALLQARLLRGGPQGATSLVLDLDCLTDRRYSSLFPFTPISFSLRLRNSGDPRTNAPITEYCLHLKDFLCKSTRNIKTLGTFIKRDVLIPALVPNR